MRGRPMFSFVSMIVAEEPSIIIRYSFDVGSTLVLTDAHTAFVQHFDYVKGYARLVCGFLHARAFRARCAVYARLMRLRFTFEPRGPVGNVLFMICL